MMRTEGMTKAVVKTPPMHIKKHIEKSNMVLTRASSLSE
jgi:hypothetical protein